MLRKYAVGVLGAIAAATALAGTVLAEDARDPYLDPPSVWSELNAGLGYWGSHNSGSPVKVGEYQDLSASPFYNVDLLRSDGCRTMNFNFSGTDEETNAANLNFYRPGFQANVDYQRFIHNLGHENLGEFPSGGQLANAGTDSASITTRQQQFLREDANAGEDYAIRVQEFKTSFKGQLTSDLKVRLDVWGLYKEGERDARAMQECYPHTYSPTDPTAAAPPVQTGGTTTPNNAHCHVLAQAQHIDWRTTEVKPVVEWNLGPMVIEYSRPMRSFSQNDQVDWRFYRQGTGAASVANEFGIPRYMEYAQVPESLTQIDQLKISAEFNDCNRFYGFLFNGNTRTESDIAVPVVTAPGFPQPDPQNDRASNRRFWGADLRWTNTSIDNVTITPYARLVEEDNQAATFVIPYEETRGLGIIEDNPTDITPINYRRTQIGTRLLWRPFGCGFGLGGLAINGNYEYSIVHRQGLEVDTGSDDPPFQGSIVEEETHSNMFSIGPSVRWSPQLDTYLRYKWYSAENPLFATNSHQSASGNSFDYLALSLKSSLPTHDDLIEIGGTFMPSDRFMLNGWLGIDIQSQRLGRALVVNGTAGVVPLDIPQGFTSQGFPFGLNGTFRATDCWSLSGGAAYYTNFINQDITLGAGADHSLASSSLPYGLLTNQWGYGSRATVINFGSTYDVTCRLRLTEQVEYVHGIQSASQIAGDSRLSAADNATLAGIPQYFRQDVNSTRVSAGIDYQLSKRWSTYFRYVLFDYQDSADQTRIASSTSPVTGLPLSGTSNLFLGGINGTF